MSKSHHHNKKGKIINRLKRGFSLSLTHDFIALYRLSVIGIFVFGFLLSAIVYGDKKSDVKHKFVSDTEIIERLINQNIDYLKYQLFYASTQISELGAQDDPKKMERILSSFVSGVNNQVDIAIAWNAFSWIDKNDFLSVDGAGGIIKKPVDLRERDYLKYTKTQPNKLIFGKPVKGALSARQIMPVATGVFTADKRYLGTLSFGLDIERILVKMQQNLSNKNLGFVIFLNEEVAFVSDGLANAKIQEANEEIKGWSQSDPSNRSLKFVDKTDLLQPESGKLIAVLQVRNTPISIVTFYDQSNFYWHLMFSAFKTMLYIIIIICLLVLFFKFTYNRVVNPIFSLSKLATRIAKKDFNYAVDKPTGREFSDLYHALNLLKNAFRKEEILIKDLQESGQSLAKANSTKDQILFSISHDIKNYIFGIGGLAKMILAKKEKKEPLKEDDLQMIEAIYRQAEELKHFVTDLIDANQIESGGLSLLNIEKVEINSLIRAVLLLNKSLLISSSVSLRTEFEENIPLLACDPRRIKQILSNLISNAIKYSKEGGEVVIKTAHLSDSDQICITIADQGFGMSEQEVEKYLSGKGGEIDKTSIAQQKNIDSHGIGVTTVLKLVELHHGKIEVESKKDQGTAIKLFFKVNSLLQKKINQEIDETLIRKKKHKSILLVEDNPVNVKITSKILVDEGHRLSFASNGKEALEILELERFDLILMDCEMPIMNGFETSKRIREGVQFTNFKNYLDIPIIALTSSVDEKISKLAQESGMTTCIEKSTSKQGLLNAINSF